MNVKTQRHYFSFYPNPFVYVLISVLIDPQSDVQFFHKLTWEQLYRVPVVLPPAGCCCSNTSQQLSGSRTNWASNWFKLDFNWSVMVNWSDSENIHRSLPSWWEPSLHKAGGCPLIDSSEWHHVSPAEELKARQHQHMSHKHKGTVCKKCTASNHKITQRKQVFI